ncbi:MAG: hypothetical protein H0X72_16305 [Acidobacteria bacterium]|jgi:hypothetical protein|nr:hypothetical protein [Acidobacteriota bacterium]
MNIERIKLFEKAIAAIQMLSKQYPMIEQFRSVKNQLAYLIDIESGRKTDCERLKDINIGLITVREIEDRNMDIANLMYEVTSEVEKMKTV